MLHLDDALAEVGVQIGAWALIELGQLGDHRVQIVASVGDQRILAVPSARLAEVDGRSDEKTQARIEVRVLGPSALRVEHDESAEISGAAIEATDCDFQHPPHHRPRTEKQVIDRPVALWMCRPHA